MMATELQRIKNKTRSGWKTKRQIARREDAKKRQAEYDNFTISEKIFNAELRRGNSARELKRLRAM